MKLLVVDGGLRLGDLSGLHLNGLTRSGRNLGLLTATLDDLLGGTALSSLALSVVLSDLSIVSISLLLIVILGTLIHWFLLFWAKKDERRLSCSDLTETFRLPLIIHVVKLAITAREASWEDSPSQKHSDVEYHLD